MAANGVSFESSSNIEERKERKRQARQEALEKVGAVRCVNLGLLHWRQFWPKLYPFRPNENQQAK